MTARLKIARLTPAQIRAELLLKLARLGFDIELRRIPR